jgi:hypothetical protein
MPPKGSGKGPRVKKVTTSKPAAKKKAAPKKGVSAAQTEHDVATRKRENEKRIAEQLKNGTFFSKSK